MKLTQFIKQHRKNWDQLDQLLQQIKAKRFTPDELEQFQFLYQKATYHLSYAKTYFPHEEVTLYLNALVSKAHNTFYRDQVTSLFQLRDFFGRTFVRLLIEQKTFVLAALLLFFLGAVGSFLSVMSDPLHLYSLLPQQIASGVDPEQLGKTGAIDAPSVSATIMTNNIQVAIFAFVGGITFGLFTLYLLINNGIILGSLAAVFWQHGKFFDFWAYILPHGIIELTAIFIAGGAGLMMGYRLFVPGPYSRKYQLKVQALRSVQLLLGTIPLFILAGIVEGYITPSSLSLQAKYSFALVTLFGLILYVGHGSLKEKRNPTIPLD